MAGAYKTPGVYIVEKNAFPNSVVEVATAVPAFVGYTKIADNKGTSLHEKPWRITSLSEFKNYFGEEPDDKFEIAEKADKEHADFKSGEKEYVLKRPNGKADTKRYYLYRAMQLFFQNGGGPCYIVSIGTYSDQGVERKPLEKGIDMLLKEQEPTMVVIPDAVALEEGDCIGVQQYSLKHCGYQMKNRFAILDIHNGFKERSDNDPVAAFRGDLGTNFLNYSAAYYPWLNTSIVQTTDLGFSSFVDVSKVSELLLAEAGGENAPQDLKDILAQVGKADRDPKAKTYLSDDELHKILFSVCPTYSKMLLAIKNKLNLLPPAAAMAGVYTMVDNARGVWKAPANVSLASVISPAVNITHDEQEDLNVTTAGKSINAIRSFIGEGTLVWGARTLDGNSLDWRYINVRRTMIMLEESLRLATKAYVFEPNVSSTWVTVKSMASNFLTSIWKRGGLAGASPEDAFSVSCGLGETMTAEDILEGYMRVTILVALSRPAEFIEITFQQQMQKS
ncbi:phage tail sheath family protein [Undibacterium sp. LX40W]|uniref:Phage tail sheath family protein n=1 Tax=Undibacterium nitidum TaxID=2762298 RepID=A0A923HZV9_9BURK|nr:MULTISPECIES: phage tail sheath C-terminal domain-containing protein [Undibacterium]MBC3883331.1 phage tail sheath family protein [Undibacterium nitidum]MBC3893613.1 phage tail sheath family protein [Undibacterium sp. LX40W]